MPTPILQQMLGQGGTMQFIDAAVSGTNFDFLVVNTAATFTTLTGTGGENLLTAYAMSGKSVAAGIVISGYMLKEYLAMKGFQMEWVKSAHAAKVLLKNKMPELIVLDVGLPDMDGFQLAQWIKITYPAVPFLFLTARVLKIDVLKGFNLGAEDYIKKPIDEEELVMRM